MPSPSVITEPSRDQACLRRRSVAIHCARAGQDFAGSLSKRNFSKGRRMFLAPARRRSRVIEATGNATVRWQTERVRRVQKDLVRA